MTDPLPPDDLPPDSADDLLAAEYVLGTLEEPARRAAARRAEIDGAFAALIREWEGRLAPLDAGYEALETAPDLLPGIEARLFDAGTGRRRAGDAARSLGRRGRWLGGWLLGGMSGLALAALALIAVLFWQPSPPPAVPLPDLRGELRAEAEALVFEARWDGQAEVLDIVRLAGPAAAEGQDYELWVIDDSGVPRSLGLLRQPETRITAPLAEGMTLAISLEPAGGSPDPTPTGPVLTAAPLVPAPPSEG